jgi:hypothetical protein
MPIIKLSGVDLDQEIELDDDLFGRFLDTVDAQDDLTMPEAFRRGLQHVVDEGPLGGGGQQ